MRARCGEDKPKDGSFRRLTCSHSLELAGEGHKPTLPSLLRAPTETAGILKVPCETCLAPRSSDLPCDTKFQYTVMQLMFKHIPASTNVSTSDCATETASQASKPSSDQLRKLDSPLLQH